MAAIDEIKAQIAKQNEIKVVDPDKIGFNGMTSQDFMKLLITQLQNQDPSNPMDSDQLLNQVSSMRQLQANLELENSLKGLTLSQQLGSATSFIGKTITASVTASDNTKSTVSGVVDSVLVKDSKTYLKVDGQQIALTDVTDVSQ